MKISPLGKVISAAAAREECLGQGKLTEEQYVTEIARSVPISNLCGWYQSFTAVLGQEKGREWYLKIKNDAELRQTPSKYCTGDRYFRGVNRVNLVATVLNLHDLDVTMAEEAYKIIWAHNCKNIKAIRADFDKKFGKKPQQRYFKVLRPLIGVVKEK